MDATELVKAATAVGAGVAGAWKVIKEIMRRRAARKEAERVEAEDRVARKEAERVEAEDRVARMVTDVHHAVMPNGGDNLCAVVESISREVSDIRRAQLRMDRRERVSMEMLKLAHAVADVRGNWTEVDSTMQKMAGLGRDELLGLSWLNAVCDGDRERLRVIWRRAVVERTTVHTIFAWERPDGTLIPVELRAGLLVATEGQMIEADGFTIMARQVERAMYDAEAATPGD